MTVVEETAAGTIERLRAPVRQAQHAPGFIYNSPEHFAREKENIFMRDWLFVAHEQELESSGDYLTLRVLGEPALLTRDNEGKLNAFANVCLHRGVEVATGRGNLKEFMCPYHGWCYGLDGQLTATVDMDRTAGFCKEDYGLIPIKVDSWGGFLFVNFDPDCESLADYLGDLPDNLASHRLADMANVRTVERELNHNWKLFVENLLDVYHAATLHVKTIGAKRGRADQYPFNLFEQGGV